MKKRSFQDKKFHFELSIKTLLALTGLSGAVWGDNFTGLIGGRVSDNSAYAAFVSSSGALSVPSGLPSNGAIDVVALQQGIGLVGGFTNVAGEQNYAALIYPNLTVLPLSLSVSGGTINCAALNPSGKGLIGGYDAIEGYAAFISSDGTVTPLSVSSTSSIQAVSINSQGVGLLGGEGGMHFITYAGFAAADGTVIPISGLPSDFYSVISTAAINDQGQGILGGFISGNSYAAFVNYGETPVASLITTPSGIDFSWIRSADINPSGLALIGGQDGGSLAYAGYVQFGDSTVSPLFGDPFSGTIVSVALNSSGSGIIGGQEGSNLYAALTQPNGTLILLISDSIIGSIDSVAINDAGVGLIGGQINSTSGYAAIVSPNGTLTPLAVTGLSTINSVAVIGAANQVVPQSIGPYLSVQYTQLAAGSALETRFIEKNPTGGQPNRTALAHSILQEDNLTCSKEDLPKSSPTAKTPKNNSIWIAPFGDYIHLKAEGAIPNYSNEIGGGLIGYDHEGSNYIVGATFGYAFNYIQYGKGQGHGKLQEELLGLYGSYFGDHLRLSGAVWGGLYQFSNLRRAPFSIVSTANTHGWILSPHVKLGSPWTMDDRGLYVVEPFFMLDWVNNWQNGFTESGSSGLNVQMGSLYNSLLQSEAGLRFYEKFLFGWGDLCLEEKISYVNQAPFHFNSVATSFVGAASTFPVAVGSNKVENLGAIQLMGTFHPKNSSLPYGGFSFQATANQNYQSYFANVFTGMDF